MDAERACPSARAAALTPTPRATRATPVPAAAKATAAFVTRRHSLALLEPAGSWVPNLESPDPLMAKEEGAAQIH